MKKKQTFDRVKIIIFDIIILVFYLNTDVKRKMLFRFISTVGNFKIII